MNLRELCDGCDHVDSDQQNCGYYGDWSNEAQQDPDQSSGADHKVDDPGQHQTAL